MVAVLMLTSAICASAQKNGSITGIVRGTAPGVVVVATNQVTSKVTRVRVGADGRYAARVLAGAYRVAVALPYVAKFDQTKNYGEQALIRDEVLENVIVSEGKETKIDFTVEKREEKPPLSVSTRKPTGAAGQSSVESEPQTQADRRAMRDRWRIGFPEYDRYGDKGARGRDIPFTKGHWYDPYHQSKLKGDYPIIGNQTFMILSDRQPDVYDSVGSQFNQRRVKPHPKTFGCQQRSSGQRRVFWPAGSARYQSNVSVYV